MYCGRQRDGGKYGEGRRVLQATAQCGNDLPEMHAIDWLRRLLVTGKGATLDELAQVANEDRQVAALDNGAASIALCLRSRCGQ